jgi:hypothetical protein
MIYKIKMKTKKIPKPFYIRLERDTPDTIIGIETDKNGNVIGSNGYSESIHIILKNRIKKMTQIGT